MPPQGDRGVLKNEGHRVSHLIHIYKMEKVDNNDKYHSRVRVIMQNDISYRIEKTRRGPDTIIVGSGGREVPALGFAAYSV